jgi:hypothetical protein
MSGLEPPKDAELNQALLDDDFGADLLARAGAVFPRQQFYVSIFWKQADIQIFKEVLEWLGERGPPEIGKFLQGAIFVQPKCPHIQAFRDRYFPALGPLAADIASQIGNFGLVRDVSLGLQVLSKNSGDSDFRGTLGEFRARLQDTGSQIGLLKKYKGLHNCLHNLQGQLVGIEATVTVVRTLGASRGLRKLAFNLKPLSDDAREQTAGLPHPEREIEWIDEFDSYIANMIRIASLPALAAADVSNVSDIPNLLRALLRQQAPRINTLLVNAADALKLGSFAETMTTIADKISAKGAPNDPALPQLTGSAEAVTRLQLRLMALVDQHYVWQDLNTPLDEAESSQNHQPQVRIPQWDRFRKKLEGLCARYPNDDWSKGITQLMSTWIKVTPSVAPNATELDAGNTAFDAFARACLERFIKVDTQLNDLSDEVAEVAKPLDTLLSQIP